MGSEMCIRDSGRTLHPLSAEIHRSRPRACDSGVARMAAAIDSRSFEGFKFSYPFAMPGEPAAPVES